MMGDQQWSFPCWRRDVGVICNVLGGLRELQIELSSKVIIPWKRIQNASPGGKSGKSKFKGQNLMGNNSVRYSFKDDYIRIVKT